MKRFALLVLLASSGLFAQVANGPSIITVPSLVAGSPCPGGLPNMQIAGSGVLYTCQNNVWVKVGTGPLAVATTGTFVSQAFVGGQCTAIQTVTVQGATVGTNAAYAAPVFSSAPTGNIGLLSTSAWVSAANTISVQSCAIGVLATALPAFTVQVLMY